MSLPLLPCSGAFASEQHAREHLCDHVLTSPEACDWAVLLPAHRHVVGSPDQAAVREFAQSLFAAPPFPAGEELVSAYQARIHLAIDDAVRLGWWWEVRDGKYSEWMGLGLEGIYVVWDARVIKTGFLPGSAAFPPEVPPRPRLEEPLPRQSPHKRCGPVVDSLRRAYELYRSSHYCVSGIYAQAYYAERVTQAGSTVFVDAHKALRQGKWQAARDERCR